MTFERGYTDLNGDWQSSTSYGREDLLVLAKVADLQTFCTAVALIHSACGGLLQGFR